MRDNEKEVLIIAPHADDEIIGCGGTIPRMIENGYRIHLRIMTAWGGWSDDVLLNKRKEAAEAFDILGGDEDLIKFFELPAARLDSLPIADINEVMYETIAEVRPSHIFIPYCGDLHKDHQTIAHSVMVCTRPSKIDFLVKGIYAYEVFSTSFINPFENGVFTPHLYVDITSTIHLKMEAVNAYSSKCNMASRRISEIAYFQHLAAVRGEVIDVEAAEAFMIMRYVYSLKQ